MANIFKTEKANFLKGDIVKLTLSFSYKADNTGKKQINNDRCFTKVLFWQVLAIDESCSIQEMFDLFTEMLIRDGLAKLQSSRLRYDQVIIEPAERRNTPQSGEELAKHRLHPKGLYGLIHMPADCNKGFLFKLYQVSGEQKRLYVRGCPESLVWFDFSGSKLKEDVINLETIFVSPFGSEVLTVRYVETQKEGLSDFSPLSACEAIRLHVFKNMEQKLKETEKNKKNLKQKNTFRRLID